MCVCACVCLVMVVLLLRKCCLHISSLTCIYKYILCFRPFVSATGASGVRCLSLLLPSTHIGTGCVAVPRLEEMLANETGAQAANPNASCCDFYLVHKRRFCRTAKRPGGRFCPTHDTSASVQSVEHSSAENGAKTSDNSLPKAADRSLQRVPCPINPNHTVYADKLKKHVKVCPDLRFVVDKLPYYRKDMHAFKGRVYCSNENPQLQRFTHHQMKPASLESLIARVEACYTEIIQPRIVLLGEECSGDYATADGMCATRRQSLKHSPQHRALLRCVKRAVSGFAKGRQLRSGEVEGEIDGFVELGAGKAGLSVSLREALLSGGIPYCRGSSASNGAAETTNHQTPTESEVCSSAHIGTGAESSSTHTSADFPRIVVVDMDNFRRKGDAYVRNSALPFTRLRINIKDLDLAIALHNTAAARKRIRVDDVNEPLEKSSLPSERWVAIGKHLCGACTDFAISCITAPGLVAHEEATGPTVCAVAFATCCHQLCELKHMNAVCCANEGSACITLPGTHYSFNSEEFAAIASMSSWAVSGDAVDDRRRFTGMCCKGVIDALRLAYLRQNGYREAFLCQYAELSTTGENKCIVAFR
uniref:tRNA:m(4)X modification enzyme TRM13 n=1 Tax=Trypanosoma congolense (strain IL3000) TaxID=1068625 RepID=G0UYZ1_TRYCI|nr:unnamed protein product [Trypanosoma congolense IL3000]